MNLETRANEIASFLGLEASEVENRLSQGFIANHHAVADDFRAFNPTNDEELLEWYRNTTAYIFELSAYHLDEGFNYSGMIEGVSTHLKNLGKKRVLVLGDGIGDLTLQLDRDGLTPIYNDLDGGKTAEFAQFRFGLNSDNKIATQLTGEWVPKFRANNVDAIVALDFFEHLTEVETWARECYKTLRVGGQFMAQNAFAIGSGDHGSIPMHLERNDRYEKDWLPLLESIGFINQGNSWFTK